MQILQDSIPILLKKISIYKINIYISSYRQNYEKDDAIWYIIPKDWFKRWKKYVEENYVLFRAWGVKYLDYKGKQSDLPLELLVASPGKILNSTIIE